MFTKRSFWSMGDEPTAPGPYQAREFNLPAKATLSGTQNSINMASSTAAWLMYYDKFLLDCKLIIIIWHILWDE